MPLRISYRRGPVGSYGVLTYELKKTWNSAFAAISQSSQPYSLAWPLLVGRNLKTDERWLSSITARPRDAAVIRRQEGARGGALTG